MHLAGTPTTVVWSGIFLVTTAPAPTLTFEPMEMPCKITAPEPIRVSGLYSVSMCSDSLMRLYV